MGYNVKVCIVLLNRVWIKISIKGVSFVAKREIGATIEKHVQRMITSVKNASKAVPHQQLGGALQVKPASKLTSTVLGYYFMIFITICVLIYIVELPILFSFHKNVMLLL